MRGAMALMCSRMVARDAGWKILESERRVTRSVFEGGEGEVSGGSVVRSRDKGLRERFADSEEGDEAPVCGGVCEKLVLMGEGDCLSVCRAMLAVCWDSVRIEAGMLRKKVVGGIL